MPKSLIPTKLYALKQAFKEGYAAVVQMKVGGGGEEKSLLGGLVKLSSEAKFVFLALGSHSTIIFQMVCDRLR